MAFLLDERTAQKGKACEELHVAVDGESIGDIVEKNQKLILRYYDDVLTHAGKSFNLAWLSAIGAFVIFAMTLIAVFGLKIWEMNWEVTHNGNALSWPASITFGGLGVVSGAIVQIYSGVAFHLYQRAAGQFGAFHTCLVRTHRYLVACPDRDAREEQYNSHEPKRDCGRVDAHRPSPSWLRSATKTNPSHQTSSIVAPGAFGSNATLCGDTADRSRRYRCSGRPIRAAFPSPNPAARITRAYKLRLQPAETPERGLPGGSFLWRSKRFLYGRRFCRSV
jgi:hypothetical protein